MQSIERAAMPPKVRGLSALKQQQDGLLGELEMLERHMSLLFWSLFARILLVLSNTTHLGSVRFSNPVFLVLRVADKTEQEQEGQKQQQHKQRE